MRGIADLDIFGTRNRRARPDQVDGIKHAGAILALVAARPLIAAMGTGADHVAVGQEAAVGGGIGLLGGAQFQKAVLPELRAKCSVKSRFCAEEERPKLSQQRPNFSPSSYCNLVPFGAIVGDRHALFQRRQFDRRAMLVGGANRQRVIAPRPAEAREDVGRQHRTHQIAQMLDARDIGDGGGDQDALHEDFAVSSVAASPSYKGIAGEARGKACVEGPPETCWRQPESWGVWRVRPWPSRRSRFPNTPSLCR